MSNCLFSDCLLGTHDLRYLLLPLAPKLSLFKPCSFQTVSQIVSFQSVFCHLSVTPSFGHGNSKKYRRSTISSFRINFPIRTIMIDSNCHISNFHASICHDSNFHAPSWHDSLGAAGGLSTSCAAAVRGTCSFLGVPP